MAMRLFFNATLGALLLTGCCKEQPHLADRTIIDLTYPFDSTTIYWPTEKGFRFEKGFEGITPNGFFYSANTFSAPEHGGTHIDAPIHFAEGKNTVDAIPVKQLVGIGVVVDVTAKCTADRDYQVLIEDIAEWERRHGELPKECIILLRTGFGKYWPHREEYLGTSELGAAAVAKLRFPGLHPETAKWLLSSRSIKAIGIDTPSIDYGQSVYFESHVALFTANIPAFENVANLDQLPDAGFSVVALPMNIKGGSGGPLRIIALLD
ncbi:MAG: cyclase family protein [Bacteroidetes bacterium]|nr:cyclase family protein [Bacteroidota bacterium]MCW5897338.1 cyclase family protein [Bacteroidota bacterium]